jgi:DNA-binding CsgD family transcriptional regulator
MFGHDHAATVLELFAHAVVALDSGLSPDRVVLDHLAEAVDATSAAVVRLRPGQPPRITHCWPLPGARSPALEAHLLAVGGELSRRAGYQSSRVRLPGGPPGSLLYAVLRPYGTATPATPAETVSEVFAFVRATPFSERDQELWACAQQPLAVLWAHLELTRERPSAWSERRNTEDGLSPREAEVLTLLADGLLAKSIASRLSVSVRTVHKHLGSAYRKLGVHDRLIAVRIAQQRGWIPAPATMRPTTHEPRVPEAARAAQ